MSNDSHHITVEDSGRVIGRADVRVDRDNDRSQAAMSVESGQLPPGSRARIVDAVLNSPDVQQTSQLQASVPAGESEMIDRVRERCSDVETRRAGSTTLVEGAVHKV